MPRKPSAKPKRKPAPRRAQPKPQQAQTQRQAFVINIGDNAQRRAPVRRRRAAPKQTIEEAEYIAALNRTMPAVQITPAPVINPPPVNPPVPLLSQEQAVGLLQTALSMQPSKEKSIAQKDAERRQAVARMSNTNRMLEKSLADIRSRSEPIDIPAHSSFSFKDTPDVVPIGEPAVDKATIPFDLPSRWRDTTIVDEPASNNIHVNALNAPNRDVMSGPEAGFPKPTLPEAGDFVPIMRRDPDFAFNTITTGVRRTIPVPKERPTSPISTITAVPKTPRPKVSMVSRIAKVMNMSEPSAQMLYQEQITELVREGKTKKQAQDILTKRYKMMEEKKK